MTEDAIYSAYGNGSVAKCQEGSMNCGKYDTHVAYISLYTSLYRGISS